MTTIPYSAIRVSGADAFGFLQAQVSNDLRRLDGQERLLAAWCNPKGRVICIVTILRSASDYLLILPAELADEVLRRLTLFRFRAKVAFDTEPATAEQLGIDGSVADWQLDKLRAGQPEIHKAQSEAYTPHMLNLDLLGAVSFDKGCYPGQEIVARTHYRGASKRRLYRFESARPVAAGDKVSDGERDVGVVVNAIGRDLLAVVSTDKADAALAADGIGLTRVELPYA